MSTWSTGNGIFCGLKALAARCSSTAESLPPLKSRTGRSDSAATSRMMKMASDSSRSRWPKGWPKGPTRGVPGASVCPGRPEAVPAELEGRDASVAAVSMDPFKC